MWQPILHQSEVNVQNSNCNRIWKICSHFIIQRLKCLKININGIHQHVSVMEKYIKQTELLIICKYYENSWSNFNQSFTILSAVIQGNKLGKTSQVWVKVLLLILILILLILTLVYHNVTKVTTYFFRMYCGLRLE
jgi:hypothetical protein